MQAVYITIAGLCHSARYLQIFVAAEERKSHTAGHRSFDVRCSMLLLMTRVMVSWYWSSHPREIKLRWDKVLSVKGKSRRYVHCISTSRSQWETMVGGGKQWGSPE